MKSRFSLLIFVLLLAILACVSPPSSAAPTGAPSTSVPLIPTNTPLPSVPDSTETLTFTAAVPTETATAMPSSTPTSTASPTRTPTALPTNTSLPALPDFSDSLSFGTGGAEDGACQSAYVSGSTLCTFFDDSRIGPPSGDKASIGVVNPIVDGWITMFSQAFPLEVSGRNYPSGSPVYILLYAEVRDLSLPTPTAHPFYPDAHYQLVVGQVAIADSSGSVHAMITARWENGRKYLLVGSIDQNGQLQLETGVDRPFRRDPWGVFWARVETASSCPSAPPQRMIVNRRGSVCTQGDTVRLRDRPARSASTIVFLPVGSQFTVIGGPSCADDWSWWQIQTDNGYSGWISEGGDNVDPYFICPLP